MKSAIFILNTLFLLTLYACKDNDKKGNEALANMEEAIPIETEDTSIERGKYLVTLMDCNTCHTPMKMTEQGPVPDMSRMLSGYPSDRPVPQFDGAIVGKGALFPHPDLTAMMGPWGISFAGNLTPHETGIGSWSLQQFSKAIREGKFKGLENSRPLLPPMPWQSYANLTDTDLEAIFNYLKSIPPVDNVAPAYITPSGSQ